MIKESKNSVAAKERKEAMVSIKRNGSLKKILERIPRYFPDLPGTYYVKKAQSPKTRKCSKIYEWTIMGEHKIIEEILIKQAVPNALYHTDTASDVRQEYETLAFLNKKSAHSFRVPRALDYFPEDNLLVMEKVKGESLKKIIDQSPFKKDGRDLESIFKRCGQWLRHFHEATATGTETQIDTAKFIEKVRTTISMCKKFALNTYLLNRVDEGMCRLTDKMTHLTLPVAMKHGDYQPRNILVDGRTIIALDISANKNDVVIKDVCNFLIGFRILGIQSVLPLFAPQRASQLEEAFLQGYYAEDSCPLAAIRFFYLLGLLESFEKVCSRRGWILRYLRICPFYTRLIKEALDKYNQEGKNES